MVTFRRFLIRSLIYLRNTLVGTAAIAGLILLTFLFTRDLSTETYSERMLYASLIVMIIAGIVVLGARSARRSFGIPSLITKPEHAKKLLDNLGPMQAKMEERIDAGIQLWVVGLACLALSALVQALGDWLLK